MMESEKHLINVWLPAAVAIWLLSILAAPPAWSDIYRYIDEDGVMHFTNAPTSSKHRYKVFIKERPRRTSRHSSTRYDHIISDASKRYGVDSRLIKAIIRAESDFNPRAVSRKGAKGLMQIMPENFRLLKISDPYDPRQSIMGGARYFKELYQRYQGRLSLSLAAYNAGPTAVDRYKTIPPYQETEQYVERVLKFYYQYKNL
jgi:soluble lytic murein transglycosylase